MYTFFVVVHVLACILLVAIVLLQSGGKGASMGVAFGGGASQTIFGPTGANTFLGRITTIIAVVFMTTSLFLGVLSANRVKTSIMDKVDKVPVKTMPAPAKKAPAPNTTKGQNKK